MEAVLGSKLDGVMRKLQIFSNGAKVWRFSENCIIVESYTHIGMISHDLQLLLEDVETYTIENGAITHRKYSKLRYDIDEEMAVGNIGEGVFLILDKDLRKIKEMHLNGVMVEKISSNYLVMSCVKGFKDERYIYKYRDENMNLEVSKWIVEVHRDLLVEFRSDISMRNVKYKVNIAGKEVELDQAYQIHACGTFIYDGNWIEGELVYAGYYNGLNREEELDEEQTGEEPMHNTSFYILNREGKLVPVKLNRLKMQSTNDKINKYKMMVKHTRITYRPLSLISKKRFYDTEKLKTV